MKILIANPGSTSLKFKLYEFPQETIIATGKIERMSEEQSPYAIKTGGQNISGSVSLADYAAGARWLLSVLMGEAGLLSPHPLESLHDLSAVAFKAVHGGRFNTQRGAVELTDEVIAEMERMLPVARLHNSAYLQAIHAFAAAAPDIPRWALFEPAFHATISGEKTTYGLPIEWREKHGVRRYGFHGASHRYIAENAPKIMGWSPRKTATEGIVNCHLGGSSSLCAIRDMKSVDTTMGFSTQTGGIPHSARCENVDAWAVLFMQETLGLSTTEMMELLCSKAGLKGISGLSGDMRDLWEGRDKGHKRALLALDVWAYQVRRDIAWMTAALDGMGALVFTGGIGENGVRDRALICSGLGFLGVKLDPAKNEAVRGTTGKISAPDSKTEVWVIPTNEELIVGRATALALQAKQ
ncbi:MAG: acetate/propionate family kinase [bacterium]